MLNTQPSFISKQNLLTSVKDSSDALTLADIIIGNTSEIPIHGRDFQTRGERTVICFAILYVKESGEYGDNGGTFHDLFSLLKSGLEEIRSKVECRLPSDSPAKELWDIVKMLPEDTQRKIIAGAAMRIYDLLENNF